MKNLLSTRDLSRDQAITLLDIAEDMAEVNERDVKKLPALRGKTIVNLFFEADALVEPGLCRRSQHR